MTPKDVQHLFDLARIEATDEELKKLPGELDSILNYIKKLSEAQLNEAGETIDFENNMRADEVRSDDTSEELIKQFPSTEGRQLKTKKVFGDAI